MPGITFRNFHGTDFRGMKWSWLVQRSPSSNPVTVPPITSSPAKLVHETPRNGGNSKPMPRRSNLRRCRVERWGYIVQFLGWCWLAERAHSRWIGFWVQTGDPSDFQQSHAHAPLPETIILYLPRISLKLCVKLESLWNRPSRHQTQYIPSARKEMWNFKGLGGLLSMGKWKCQLYSWE